MEIVKNIQTKDIKTFLSYFVFHVLLALAICLCIGNAHDLIKACRRILFAASVFSIISVFPKTNQRNFFESFLLFVFIYMLPIYMKFVDGMVVATSEVIAAYRYCTLFFCFIWFMKFINEVIRNKLEKILGSTLLGIISILFLILPLIFIGYYILSGHHLTADIILTLFQTNGSESFAYVKSQDILLVGLAVFVMVAGITLYGYLQKSCRYQVVDSPLLVCISLALIFILAGNIGSQFRKGKMRNFYITNLAQSVQESLKSYKDYGRAKIVRMQRLKELINLQVLPNSKGLYVLVIGESLTRDHMSLYGYQKTTTPWLNTFATQKGTVVYQHAYSNHTHTVPALTYALSSKNQYNTIKLTDAYSLLEIARAAGFTTYWISNQQKYGAWDTPVAEIASTADHEIWLNQSAGKQIKTDYYDEKLVDHLRDMEVKGNTLIVIHLMGSHGTYADRYPKEYEKFGRDTVGTYDNSVLYNDTVLRKIYEAVSENKEYQAMVYFSDHGEDADRKVSHEATKFTYRMSHIPLIVHLSQRYRNNREQYAVGLQNHREAYWSNDLLFDMMVGLMGIKNAPSYSGEFDLGSAIYSRTKENTKTLHGRKMLDGD